MRVAQKGLNRLLDYAIGTLTGGDIEVIPA
jgi:hypothetical protein